MALTRIRAFRRTSAVIADYVSLTKPRIVVVLMLTAYGAMTVASGGVPSPWLSIVTLLGLGLAAGGAHAVNMWYDRDIDPLMARTRNRPIPAGRIQPRVSLAMGLVMAAVAAILLVVTVDWLTAALTVAGFLYYVVIYTMTLKRRTAQNIVIGGAAGAFPPLVGWAAVTHQLAWPAWMMFLIIFLWTPPHFWSLALFRAEDYRRAHVPMMPVAHGEQATKRQSVVYAGLTLLATLGLAYAHLGWVYVVIAGSLALAFFGANVRLLKEKLPDVRWAKRTFGLSVLFMSGLVIAIVVGTLV